MKNVTLRQLRVFALAARHLSFSRAARELHLSQPAVSMQIRQLEASADLPLFQRVGRGVTLTEAGHRLLECAAGIDELLQSTQESMDAMRGLKTGTLKLGAVSTAKYFAPSIVAAFSAQNAGITVRFSVGDLPEITRQLAGNEIDLVISGLVPQDVATLAKPFARHPYAIIAAPQHALAKRRKVSLKDLEGERILTRQRTATTGILMDDFFRKHRVRYRSFMESTSNETIKQAVVAGLGISFLSLHTASLELSTGKLVVLDIKGLPIMGDWFVLQLRDKQLSPVATAFREFVLEHGAAIVERTTGIRLPVRGRRAVKARKQ
jgi:DNA-binding transcriptional LysR family regulator